MNSAPLLGLRERCEALLPRLKPLHFFSHATSAGLWGMPLPARVERSGWLDVGAIPPEREPRRPDVVGHRLRLWVDELTMVGGLPVAHPAETWAQLGSILGLDALVAVADDLRHRGLADAPALRAAAVRLRRRGAVDLKEAVLLSRDGVESPRETQTRLEIVRGGLPEPLVNWTLRDDRGRFVARLDLSYPRYRVAIEYDGAQHADLVQFTRDADRWDRIRDQSWTLVRVLSHHLADPHAGVVLRTRRALLAAGWCPDAG